MKLIDRIKSDNFALGLAIFSVIIQGGHSAYVFMSLTSFSGWLAYTHSISMAMIISGAILYFTLKKNKKLSLYFSIFESLINIAYYIKFMIVEEKSFWLLTIAVPIAVVLPITVYYYSEHIDTLPTEKRENPEDSIYKFKLIKSNKTDQTYEFRKV